MLFSLPPDLKPWLVVATMGVAAPAAWAQEPDPAEAPDAAAAEGRVPARFFQFLDAASQRWGLRGDGAVGLTSGALESAMELSVDGQRFVPEAAEPDLTGPVFGLSGTAGEVEVRREIWLDLERGGARYLDRFALPDGTEAREVTVSYKSHLAAGTVARTSSGRAGSEGVRGGDFGVAIGTSETDIPSAGIIFGDSSGAVRPDVELGGGGEMLVSFALPLEPGAPARLLQWVGQRPSAVPDDAGAWFSPFYAGSRLVDARVNGEAGGEVRNFAPAVVSGEGLGLDGVLAAVRELEKRLGVERGSDDLYWVSETSQLAGTVNGGPVAVDSRYGAVTVELAEVAALKGGAGRGDLHRIFLRDGTVLSGEATADGLELVGERGWAVDLSIPQLDYLFFRSHPSDGKPPEGATCLFATHHGDVLPAALDEAATLGFESPWGSAELAIAAIGAIDYHKRPSPRYRMALADGSRLTGFLSGRDLALTHARLGDLTLRSTDLAAMTRVGEAAPAPEVFDQFERILSFDDLVPPPPEDRALCLLQGGNVLAGTLAMEKLAFVSGTTVTALDPAEIVSLRRDEEAGSDETPVFVAAVAGGDEIRGALRHETVTLEAAGRRWDVPVRHFLAFRRPPAP